MLIITILVHLNNKFSLFVSLVKCINVFEMYTILIMMINNKTTVFYISKYGVGLYKRVYNVDTENLVIFPSLFKSHVINCLLFQSVNMETVHVFELYIVCSLINKRKTTAVLSSLSAGHVDEKK